MVLSGYRWRYVMDIKGISAVAIYLRKSRGDEGEDVLLKHRERLIGYSQSKGWKYETFEEVASGERLSSRPVIQRLLDLVEQGLYDGVLVVDYDRLSRGGTKDFGEIVEVFQYANTFIITPDRIYDVNDGNDRIILGFQGVISNAEYEKIKMRLVNGKKDGATQGKWTNGKPPFPYEYEREIITDEKNRVKVQGKVVINQKKNEIYQVIKHRYLVDKKGTEEIAVWLNKQNIPSPNGTVWHNNAISRLLVHEFHLGKVVYGKNNWKKDRDGKRKIANKKDESEWFTGVGEHEQLKSQEEHEDILRRLSQNNKIPKRSRQGSFPTTGLMFCAKCGHMMKYSVGRLEAKTGIAYDYTKCGHKNPYGMKCTQKGVKMDEDFYDSLYTLILNKFTDDERLDEIQGKRKEQSQGKALLRRKKAELDEQDKALNKIMEAFENGAYSMSQFSERKKVRDEAISKLKKDIIELEQENQNSKVYKIDELKQKAIEFRTGWASAINSLEKNLLLKSIVNRLEYDREGDNISFSITWL
jgi:DNA invertase Pin-like site-specific DNA recombinase